MRAHGDCDAALAGLPGAAQAHREASQNSDASTVAGSFWESSSDGSSHSCEGVRQEAVAWEEIRFAHRIQPYHHKADCVDDFHLLSCFLELAGLTDIEGDAVKLLLRVLRFLRLCDYSMEDVCSILAHASAYFVDAYALCGKQMDANEVGNVLATLVFIAHCYVQDETCPLHVWHRHLFRKYCPLVTLNAAVVRLLEIRHYKLRLETEDMNRRFTCLLQAAQHRRARQVLDASVPEREDTITSAINDCSAGIRQLSLGKRSQPKRRQCTFSF